MPCTANALMSAAATNGYYGLSTLDLKRAILYMLCSGLGSGISGVTGNYDGDYGGIEPTVTPSGAALVRDSSNGALWWYDGAAWHSTGIVTP